MARRDLWDEVEDILIAGGEPVIEVSPSTRVIEPKKPRGRPPVRKPGARPYEHYETHTPTGHRMRCRAQGCEVKLKRGQVLVCSTQCEIRLRESCELYLAILNGEIPAAELPPYMRSNRLRRGQKFTM